MLPLPVKHDKLVCPVCLKNFKPTDWRLITTVSVRGMKCLLRMQSDIFIARSAGAVSIFLKRLKDAANFAAITTE